MNSRTHSIMHFLAAVQRQNQADVVIGKIFYLFLIQKHTIGCQGKFEQLIVLLFLFTAISDCLLYHMPVHQRFSAEEIHFQVLSRTAVRNQEVYGAACHIKAHKHAPLAITALSCKAVFTAKIAVVSDIETKCLDNRPFRYSQLIIIYHRCKQNLLFNQFINFIHVFIELAGLISPIQTVMYCFSICAIIIRQHIVGHIIHHVKNSTINVHNNVHAILLKAMNHWFYTAFHYPQYPPNSYI